MLCVWSSVPDFANTPGSQLLLSGGGGAEGFRLYSIEVDDGHARVAREIIEMAGFGDRVEVIVAHDVEDGLTEVVKRRGVGGGEPFVDVLFVDHDKDCYLPDIKIIIDAGALLPGAVVVADNVLMGRIDDYLEFVRGEARREGGIFVSSRLVESTVEYCEPDKDDWGEDDLKDGVEISVLR